MPFEATVYVVMLSGPSDINQFKPAVHRAAARWNRKAERSKVVLLVRDWEQDVAAEMGGTGQDVINKRLTDVADIILGIFWHRIGTAGKQDVSGTAEEIRLAIGAGKPGGLFFCKSALPHNVDTKQLEGLRTFKQACNDQGLYKEFESEEQLEGLVFDSLETFIHDLSSKQGQIRAESAGSQPEPVRTMAVPKTESKLALSKGAYILLMATYFAPDGVVQGIYPADGLFANDNATIKTSGIILCQAPSRRERMDWRAAALQLLNSNLLTDTVMQVDSFTINQRGYKTVELSFPDALPPPYSWIPDPGSLPKVSFQPSWGQEQIDKCMERGFDVKALPLEAADSWQKSGWTPLPFLTEPDKRFVQCTVKCDVPGAKRPSVWTYKKRA